ncbi:hypothetical protein [Edaphobacter dinghuensis]|uniref:Uncharacterized protein n=1 Tax=Edaphobacter dinghuensis TaxID=1560005 RepID=A0A917MB30_9BACT|nr:hypothetical protein [Edaphobacter dinghuensis]GGG89043.1 hypothetical protein GCM10011585_36510 [Edaphobacter dinghuensis]
MRKSTRYSLLIALALVAALAVAIFLRKAAPPEAARLLPESDAIVYFNLKPLRLATHFDRTTVTRSADYQHFIDATGIVPERDLDDAAFALHRMDDPNGPNGPVGYSEVFEGRFDAQRFATYLATIATSQETYDGHTIFTIPVGDLDNKTHTMRQLRVAQLDYDTIAASNMPTTEQIHSILDRHRAAASPFSGSSLLSARYGDVPLLSSAWAIGHIGLPFSERGYISVLGLQLPLPEDTTFVASLRYVGTLHLRVEQIAPTDAEAARSAETLNTLLNLFRSIQQGQPRVPADASLRAMIASLKIEQHKDRTVLTGTVPLELLKQLTAAPASPQP